MVAPVHSVGVLSRNIVDTKSHHFADAGSHGFNFPDYRYHQALLASVASFFEKNDAG